jgi:hypothetical protein
MLNIVPRGAELTPEAAMYGGRKSGREEVEKGPGKERTAGRMVLDGGGGDVARVAGWRMLDAAGPRLERAFLRE